MGRVEGKVALVTGGASGIGAGCAGVLAREGAAVVITDVQDAKGEALAAEIGRRGRLPASRRHQRRRLDRDHRRGRAPVRPAGHAGQQRRHRRGLPLDHRPSILADFKRQQAVNVEGVFLGVKHALPLMRKAGNGGSIINMSSVAGLKGSSLLAAYCATKGAVRLFTKAIALECGEHKDGVRVNSVHPGLIETPIWEGIAGGRRAGRQRADRPGRHVGHGRAAGRQGRARGHRQRRLVAGVGRVALRHRCGAGDRRRHLDPLIAAGPSGRPEKGGKGDGGAGGGPGRAGCCAPPP